MSNTRPPTDNVVSVWTTADQARLNELQERRRRIFAAHMDRLALVLQVIFPRDAKIGDIAEGMIPVADELIAALTPFATPKE